MRKTDKLQEVRKCKNKKCQRTLPEGYKYKYCENCRIERAEKTRGGIKAGLGLAASAGLFIVTKGKLGEIGGKKG